MLDRSAPLHSLRCQALMLSLIAFFALALMAGEKLWKSPRGPSAMRDLKVPEKVEAGVLSVAMKKFSRVATRMSSLVAM